jgi:hypothetical protein
VACNSLFVVASKVGKCKSKTECVGWREQVKNVKRDAVSEKKKKIKQGRRLTSSVNIMIACHHCRTLFRHTGLAR